MMITAAKLKARDSFFDCLTLEDGTDRSSGNVGTTTNFRCLNSQKNADLKCKVAPLPVVKACWVIGGVFPLFLNQSSRWRHVISFKPHCFTFHERDPCTL